ncbi:MAG TPA: hypothetical protein VIQ80_01110 [Candidatus Saccharimonadales bacterium]
MRRISGKSIDVILGLVSFGALTWQIYAYWDRKAAYEVATSKTYRLTCPNGSIWDCSFVELPNRVNWLGDVLVPTVFSTLVVLLASLALRYVIRHPEVLDVPKKHPSP